jgi:hypothetical protein
MRCLFLCRVMHKLGMKPLKKNGKVLFLQDTRPIMDKGDR